MVKIKTTHTPKEIAEAIDILNKIFTIETVPVTSHYSAKRTGHRTKGIELIDLLLDQQLVNVVQQPRVAKTNFVRFTPSGMRVVKCLTCEKINGRATYFKARNIKELEWALGITRKFQDHYICSFCQGNRVAVWGPPGKWHQVKTIRNRGYRCKICMGQSKSYQGMLAHFRRVKRMKPMHLKALEIAIETGKLP